MNTLINIFSNNTGWIARWITGLIVGGTVSAFAYYGFHISVEDNAKITAVVVAAVTGAIGEIVLKYKNKNATEIQSEISKIAPEVYTDGHVGNITKAAITRAVEAIKNIQEAGIGGTSIQKEASIDMKT